MLFPGFLWHACLRKVEWFAWIVVELLRASLPWFGSLLEHGYSLMHLVNCRYFFFSTRDLSKAVSGMLRLCNSVVFVDPHFRPQEIRFRRSLESFLNEVVNGRAARSMPKRVEIQTGDDLEYSVFVSQCKANLPKIVPPGLKIRIIRLRQRPEGEKLHNRYILTDIGGVSFNTGLDEGDDGESDDLQLLTKEQYLKRWRQYADATAFDLAGHPVDLDGPRG